MLYFTLFSRYPLTKKGVIYVTNLKEVIIKDLDQWWLKTYKDLIFSKYKNHIKKEIKNEESETFSNYYG